MESENLHKIGRPRSIDRDHVLDMAEKLVAEGGLVALTMDAVAQASGVTKGAFSIASAIRTGF